MKRKTLFLLMLASLIIVAVTAAQSLYDQLSVVVELGPGYTIAIPGDWQVTQQDVGTALSGGGIQMLVFDPVDIGLLLSGTYTDREPLLRDLYERLYGQRPERRDLYGIRYGLLDGTIWLYQYPGSNLEGIFTVVTLPDGNYGAVDAGTTLGNLPNVIELIFTIVSTFSAGDTLLSPVIGETCRVSTDRDTVDLRVGPGRNRTVLASMPAGRRFEAVGRFVASDGSIWFQLKKEEVLPQSSASQVWVAGRDVEQSGDCDRVVLTQAPPIIPISNPVTPFTLSGTPLPPDSVIPQAGRWTMYYAAESLSSCERGGTRRFPTTRLFGDKTSLTSLLNVSSDGTALVFAGVSFTRSQNIYRGAITLDSGATITIAFFVGTTPTVMGGEMIYSIISNGVGCSITTPFTALLG